MDEVTYWKIRCLAAEDYIHESPCDPDIFKKQIEAYEKWQDLKDKESEIIKNKDNE